MGRKEQLIVLSPAQRDFLSGLTADYFAIIHRIAADILCCFQYVRRYAVDGNYIQLSTSRFPQLEAQPTSALCAELVAYSVVAQELAYNLPTNWSLGLGLRGAFRAAGVVVAL